MKPEPHVYVLALNQEACLMGATVKPGEKAARSRQYEELGPRAGRTGHEVTISKGERVPPTRQPGRAFTTEATNMTSKTENVEDLRSTIQAGRSMRAQDPYKVLFGNAAPDYRPSVVRLSLRLIALFIVVVLGAPVYAQVQPLDVQDISILFPPPTTPADVSALLTMSEPTDGGEGRLVPQGALEALLQTAASTRVPSSAGLEFGINFGSFTDELRKPETWKLVAIRIDPSAPGGHASVISQFGSTPQIRLVFQPVTMNGGAIKVHDVAAHIAYSFITGINPETRIPTADQSIFMAIVNDVLELRSVANRAGIVTAGSLGIHPALRQRLPEFSSSIKSFLKRRLPQGRINEMAFMGVDSSEPWIFFPLVRLRDGSFAQVSLPTLGGSTAQMLILKGGTPVMPLPQTRNVDSSNGVSTALLFSQGSGGLDVPISPALGHITRADVPDIIANPQRSTVRNTDCVSCHSESTKRIQLNIVARDESVSFARSPGVSGVDPAMLPRNPWNVRNFGWFQFGPPNAIAQATVTMRTANETAEAVEFVNREYLKVRQLALDKALPQPARANQMPQSLPVANPLTLVMTIKPEKLAELKALLSGMQAMPPEQNPISRSLTKLAIVHFARFVFLSDRQLAVITTYDGSFEDYIDAFVDNIGVVFDQLLSHMEGAPPLPVAEHRQEFLEYVRKNDIKPVGGLYSAYPELKVLDILTLQKEHQK